MSPMSRLNLVKTGKLKTPKKFFFYGAAGLGKTTLAKSAPNPILFDADGGSEGMETARYPFTDDPMTGHIPLSYDDILFAIGDLATSEHKYETLVIDTADKLEHLLHKWMCARDSKKKQTGRNQDAELLTTIEDYGYGKGFNLAVDEMRLFLNQLELLRKKGMNIIFLAHSQVKSFKNPLGSDFDRYIPKVNEKLFGVIKEWADLTGFLALDGGASKEVAGDKRYRGFSTGARILHTCPHAAFEAKTRLMLPAEIEIPQADPWAPIAKAIADSEDITLEELNTRIGLEFERFDVNSAFRIKGQTAWNKAATEGNRDQLIKILKYVESTPNEENKEQPNG